MPSSPSPIVPTASVIIVAHQRPDYLARALEHLSNLRRGRLQRVGIVGPALTSKLADRSAGDRARA